MLYRNIGKPYAIMVGEYYLWFDIFHDFVNGIYNTDDVQYAWHFKTPEDARNFIQRVSYPHRIDNYSIVYAPCN